jgi:DNA-binding transcriptional LysR family regulator
MAAQLELRHLRYFVAVAEELHFARAAARLHMAQPPLSQQVRRLEELIGTALFDRTSRRVTLTAAGEAFLDRSRTLLAQADADIDEAARIGRGELGRLDIGFISSAIPLGLTERIHAYRLRYPAVQLRLHEGFTSLILDRLLAGTVDMGVVRDSEPHPALSITTLATEPFVAVLPVDHPAAGAATLDVSLLRDDPFVFYPRAAGERAHARNLDACRAAGFEPRIVQEASSWVTILHLVEAGLGVSIAPASAAVTTPAGVRTIPLAGSHPRSEVQLVQRTDDTRAILANFLAVPGSLTPTLTPGARPVSG